MQTLEYPHVKKVDDGPARLTENPRVKVSMIVTDYQQGMSVDRMIGEYPHLSRAEVHAALGYYYDHKDEIDAEIAGIREANLRPDTPEEAVFRARVRALRTKMAEG